jgi:hypothetical protein
MAAAYKFNEKRMIKGKINSFTYQAYRFYYYYEYYNSNKSLTILPAPSLLLRYTRILNFRFLPVTGTALTSALLPPPPQSIVTIHSSHYHH